MYSRHDISDEAWERIEPLLPGRPGGHGGVAHDNRRFVNAVLYIAHTGFAWRDLPSCFGNYNSVFKRYDRWCRNGVWQSLAQVLCDEDQEWILVDSSCI